MKKVFLSALIAVLLASASFADVVFELDLAPSTGISLGVGSSKGVFNVVQGLMIDWHDITKEYETVSYRTVSNYYGGTYQVANGTSVVQEDEGAFFIGYYLQMDWQILPIKIKDFKGGVDLGFQYALGYTNAIDDVPVDMLFCPFISAQVRYSKFDVTLGWKGNVYIFQMLFDETDDGGSLVDNFRNSFQIGVRYRLGGGSSSSSSASTSSSSATNAPAGGTGSSSGGTRTISGWHTNIRRAQ